VVEEAGAVLGAEGDVRVDVDFDAERVAFGLGEYCSACGGARGDSDRLGNGP
jgi:hypothetical protein